MDYSKIAKQELPFDGEFFLSRKKRFNELVFFVHFYDGSKKQLLRHIKFVNELGFDAFAFHLKGTHKDLVSWKPLISTRGVFGAKHVYADQIETLLNLIPGSKIIFSFSNPSASAIEAMARRHCSDTKALICDSGPSARFLDSAFALATKEYKIKPLPWKLTIVPFLSVGWSPYFHKDIKKDLDTFPNGFQVLSVRGWKDELIPPRHIDEVFEPHGQLEWVKLSLPEAGHLTGLRDFRDEYKSGVEKFLKLVATPLTEFPAEVPHE